MRVERLGDREPEVAIVGGIHGDEPCGVRAVERLIEEQPTVERPVALVIANEHAIEARTRYVDDDLNRAFPGDPDAASHEKRLAAELTERLADCTTLSLHSTQSYGGRFAIVDSPGEFEGRIVPHLSVDAVVDASAFNRGRLFDSVSETIEVECGYQGSDEAAENATLLAREFLGAVGALPEERRPRQSDLPVYRLTDRVPKEPGQRYEVFASNFERVPPGEAFAAVDEDSLVAEEGFYPVLMSPYGYEDVFGYTADHVGTVDGML